MQSRAAILIDKDADRGVVSGEELATDSNDFCRHLFRGPLIANIRHIDKIWH